MTTIGKLHKARNAGKFSSWDDLLTWAKYVEKGKNLRLALRSWECASGFNAADVGGDSRVSVEEYHTFLDYLAPLPTQDQFQTHFDCISGNIFGYRVKWGKGAPPISLLLEIIGEDRKGIMHLWRLQRAMRRKWDGAPNRASIPAVGQAKKIAFKCHPLCKPSPSSKGPRSMNRLVRLKRPKRRAQRKSPQRRSRTS